MNALVEPNRVAPPARPQPPLLLAELAASCGVRFNGDAPWDIRVHDAAAYRRILTRGTLGFGEAFMDGLWDCERMDEMFHRLLRQRADVRLGGWNRLRLLLELLRHSLFNLQSTRRAYQVGERHYDIGNDVFEAMLDPTLSYSCAYWKDATTLAEAQEAKLELACRKLQLAPGERVLEIGCGWGG
ncbi:MAG: class I SAM-dependent methyltransferase, partial [Sulfuritalea sp.]|nr:class I SAM-dependent methyltransferase [Sulfuritalea sp.]